MRETSFIKQNKQKWQEFESVLEGQYHDPDKLNELFVQITDDLSYSRTFYPNRSVRVYLNGLAQRIFFTIYKSRRSPLKRFGQFWAEELPQLVHEARREFLLSFLVFALAFGIGVLSSAMDPEFVKVILGDSYVQMTVENIESGDPMKVYKQRGEFGMALGITMNNLTVAFRTFLFGVFFAIGTLVIMVYNGIMVGAFQYFFIEQGLFWESFLTIWIHGTLEISAIIIAGAAGLTMGKGLVFPGTYTRAQAFQRSARRGVKIMIGIAPIIILAGFIEGYLTRHTETPDFVRGAFILVCLLFVLIYFVWYPYIKATVGFAKPIQDSKIPPDSEQRIDFTTIKSSGEIFSDVFTFYKKHFGKIALLALAGAAVFTASAFVLSGFNLTERFIFPSYRFGVLESLPQLFTGLKINAIPWVNALTFGALMTGVLGWLQKDADRSTKLTRRALVLSFLKNLVVAASLVFVLLSNQWYTPYILLFVLPIAMLWSYTMQVEGLNIFRGLARASELLQRNLSKMMGLLVVLALVGFLFFLITETATLWFYLDLASWIANFDEQTMRQVSTVLITFTIMFVLQLLFVLFIIGFGLMYYTLREIAEATHLLERIRQIGVAKRIKGLEQEV